MYCWSFLIALYEDVVIKHRKNEVLTHFILYKILRTVCLNQTISSELFGSEISLLIVTLVIPTHNKYFYENWVFCYSFNFKTTCYSIAPFITNDNLNLNTVGGLNVTFSKFSPFIHNLTLLKAVMQCIIGLQHYLLMVLIETLIYFKQFLLYIFIFVFTNIVEAEFYWEKI